MRGDKIWSYDYASLRYTGREHNEQICSLSLKKLFATIGKNPINYTRDG